LSDQEQTKKPDYIDGATAAMRRAALRARRVAWQTGTCVVYEKDGQIVRERITEEPTELPEPPADKP